jgi:Spy/CpxP family protein refolding chaperone
MKTRLIALPVLALAAVSLVSAQPPRRFNPDATSNTTPPTPPTPAEIAANRVKRLTRFLDLTTTQQSQMTTIFTNEETALQNNRTALETARTNLTAAIKANNTSQINSILLQIAPLRTQDETTRATSAAAIYTLLTADQKTKVDNAFGMLMGGGPGGPGGPGGFGGRGPRR